MRTRGGLRLGAVPPPPSLAAAQARAGGRPPGDSTVGKEACGATRLHEPPKRIENLRPTDVQVQPVLIDPARTCPPPPRQAATTSFRGLCRMGREVREQTTTECLSGTGRHERRNRNTRAIARVGSCAITAEEPPRSPVHSDHPPSAAAVAL